MTPQPQPKEYIITEATIKKILSGHPWDEDMLRSRPHTPAAPSERIGSIRTNVFMDEDKVWLIERVNAGMGEHEYVISYLGDHFATVPSEVIAREIVEMQCHTCPVFTPEHDATIRNATLDRIIAAFEGNRKNKSRCVHPEWNKCRQPISVGCLDCYIEFFNSLRHQSTEAPK